VIKKITDRARARKIPGLTDEERNIWDNFVYHQQKRAPDAFERLGLIADFEKGLPRFIEQYVREVGPLTEVERAEFGSPEVIKRMIQQASVKARGRGAKR
jgi:hypothetical protein